MAAKALRFMLNGQADESLTAALAARDIQERTQFADEWNALISMVLLRANTWLEDFPAVEREAAAALAAPGLTEPVKLVLVPGAQALAWFESSHLANAADAAAAADKDARRLGFSHHVFALDCLRALAGLALERRDLDIAEKLTERALSISERRWPALGFQALLDRAAIWAARGHVHEALAAVEAAGRSWPGPGRCCWPGQMSWKGCCACRSATRARLLSWPAGSPPLLVACCWPRSPLPPAIITPRNNTCSRRRLVT